jgi:hypothetical protein
MSGGGRGEGAPVLPARARAPLWLTCRAVRAGRAFASDRRSPCAAGTIVPRRAVVALRVLVRTRVCRGSWSSLRTSSRLWTARASPSRSICRMNCRYRRPARPLAYTHTRTHARTLARIASAHASGSRRAATAPPAAPFRSRTYAWPSFAPWCVSSAACVRASQPLRHSPSCSQVALLGAYRLFLSLPTLEPTHTEKAFRGRCGPYASERLLRLSRRRAPQGVHRVAACGPPPAAGEPRALADVQRVRAPAAAAHGARAGAPLLRLVGARRRALCPLTARRAGAWLCLRPRLPGAHAAACALCPTAQPHPRHRRATPASPETSAGSAGSADAAGSVPARARNSAFHCLTRCASGHAVITSC